MLDIKSLETFYWVATLKSFRAAATKLNTTQPAVSQRIQQLESQIGAQLLERDNRSVSVTVKGRQMLEKVERLLKMHTQLTVDMVERQALRGVLRLGVAESIVQTWLPQFIAELDVLYPQLQLEIDVDISSNLRDRLVAHELDLAFLLGPISLPSVRNLPLSRFPLAFLASPALQLPSGPITPADLSSHPIITFARRTVPYLALQDLIEKHNLGDVRVHASASLAPVVSMATRGMGIALMPRAIVTEQIRSGQLVEISTTVSLQDLQFTASWPASPNSVLIEAIAAVAVSIAAAAGHGP
ncbi:MAG: LysR family transcriptional regulator [Beijerinckiaceae bacterium]